jgi:lipopolysaccharide transport system permease protein
VALISNPVPNTSTAEPQEKTAFFEAPSSHVCVRIRAGGSNLSAYLAELWNYRELLYFLASREVKIRYKQTVLGVTWALLQPLFTMLVFTVFFGNLAHIPSNGVPYPIFVYAALVPWTYFSNAISGSANSLVTNSNLISKVYFPRLIVPMAAVLAGWIDIAISLLILLPLTLFYKIDWTWRLAALPVLVLLLSFLTIAVGAWLSALNVKYRDVRFALPFFIQAWMFITPVIYSSQIVPPSWRWLLALNPLTGIFQAFRAATLGQQFDLNSLATSLGFTAMLLCYSLSSFRLMEKGFADII